MGRQTIAVDFDGVIHSYTSGWQGPVPTDPPVAGAREAIAKLREKFDIAVLTTRAETEDGAAGTRAYLRTHGIEVDQVTHGKVKAVLYVDDRGFRFTGDWKAVLRHVEHGGLDPWTKRLGREMKPVTIPMPPVQGGTEQEDAFRRLQLQRATVRGSEVVFLKACGWEPVSGVEGMTGQDVIDQGEQPLWRRGVKGEETWEHDEAVAFAEAAYIDAQNAAGPR